MISFDGLILVLLCALGWALLDLVRKLLAAHAAPVPSSLLLVVGQIPLFLLWVGLEGPPGGGEGPAIESGYWLPGLGSIALNLLANVAFMQSVRVAPMSRTVPLLSLTPVFATLVAIPALGERPGGLEALGIVLVVGTAFVIARESSAEGGPPGPADAAGSPGNRGPLWRRLSQHGGALMAFVALCWSITPNLDKVAMAHASAAIHALVTVVGIAVGLGLLLWRQGRMAEVRSVFASPRALAYALAAVALAAAASGIQLLALQQAPVGVVETVKRGLGATLALVFGALVFSEIIGWRRIGAVVVMISGVALVLLAVV